ncbi:MAG: formyltransferase family protein [Planctomycetota bacterium]
MHVYLFCNERYGSAFAETAALFAQRTGTRVEIVLSGKPRRTVRGGLARMLAPLAIRRRRAALADRLGVPVRVAHDVNAVRFLRALDPRAHAVIAGFNQIFRKPALERVASFVNFHPSLLPYYRGPVPSFWCLKNRERHTGFTLHRVTEAIDAGEVLHQAIVRIEDVRHPTELDAQVAAHAQPCFARWLEHLSVGGAWRRVRVSASTYYATHVEYASFPKPRAKSVRRRSASR